VFNSKYMVVVLSSICMVVDLSTICRVVALSVNCKVVDLSSTCTVVDLSSIWTVTYFIQPFASIFTISPAGLPVMVNAPTPAAILRPYRPKRGVKWR